MRLILYAAAIAFPAVTAIALIVNYRFEALAQDLPALVVFIDHNTGCEYLRGGALQRGCRSSRSRHVAHPPDGRARRGLSPSGVPPVKDHNYVDDEGRHIPTSQLPTETIRGLLRDGVEIVSTDGQEASVESVLERLRIELLIREQNL